MTHTSTTPHNNFFYQVMSRKEQALAFFGRYLPEKILSSIDLARITLSESKHMSDSGISLYNDVLYQCTFASGQPGYLFAVCEHQSTPEAQMPLRLLEYNAYIIRQHIKQKHSKFPVIVNMVLYHGSKPWHYSTAFSDYYDQPTLGKAFLDMAPFTLINIPQMDRSVIQQDPELGFCFEAFRCTSQPDPYEAFHSTMKSPIFREHFDALPQDIRYLVGAYLGHCIDRTKHSLQDLANLVSRDPQKSEEIMTSIAQAIGREYEQKGRQEGMYTKSLEIARNLLSKSHLDLAAVQEATGLSTEELLKLRE